LENGANTSFVNRIVDEKAPLDEIVADPIVRTRKLPQISHPRIALPRDLYGDRKNSAGVDLSDPDVLTPLASALDAAAARPSSAAPIVGGRELTGQAQPIVNPADTRQTVGQVITATAEQVSDAVGRAQRDFEDWSMTPAGDRAACLERAADLLESA